MSELELNVLKEQNRKLMNGCSIDLVILNKYQKIGTPEEFAVLKEKKYAEGYLLSAGCEQAAICQMSFMPKFARVWRLLLGLRSASLVEC